MCNGLRPRGLPAGIDTPDLDDNNFLRDMFFTGWVAWAPFVDRQCCKILRGLGPLGRTSCDADCHRLPNGVRTNGVFAEVPQYTIIMT